MIFSSKGRMGEYREVTGDWWYVSNFSSDDIVVSF
jgi:hypothetical protein